MFIHNVDNYDCVGFSGARNAALELCQYAVQISNHFLNMPAAVGDARGIDDAIRRSRITTVFNSKSFSPQHLVARSIDLINHLCANNGCLIAFPGQTAHHQTRPVKKWAGYGSGTWGTIAYAAGYGLPVFIYLDDETAPDWLTPDEDIPGWFHYQPAHERKLI